MFNNLFDDIYYYIYPNKKKEHGAVKAPKKYINNLEYPKLIKGKYYSKEDIIDNETNNIFFYCNTMLLENAVHSSEYYNSNDSEIRECCVCLCDISLKQMIITNCKHDICNKCYDLIIKKECPLCRRLIKKILMTDKICIVIAGEKTNLYTFENGGLLSVQLVLIPSYNENISVIYRGIKYHDDNDKKAEFIAMILSLIDNNYTFYIDEYKLIYKWAEDIQISDIFKQMNTIDELYVINDST